MWLKKGKVYENIVLGIIFFLMNNNDLKVMCDVFIINV